MDVVIALPRGKYSAKTAFYGVHGTCLQVAGKKKLIGTLERLGLHSTLVRENDTT